MSQYPAQDRYLHVFAGGDGGKGVAERVKVDLLDLCLFQDDFKILLVHPRVNIKLPD